MRRKVRLYTPIGRRIATLGNQVVLARTLKLSQQTVSKKLRGETAILLSDLEKLAAKFGLPLLYFVQEDAPSRKLAAAWEQVKAGPPDLFAFVDLCTMFPSETVESLLAMARTMVGSGADPAPATKEAGKADQAADADRGSPEPRAPAPAVRAPRARRGAEPAVPVKVVVACVDGCPVLAELTELLKSPGQDLQLVALPPATPDEYTRLSDVRFAVAVPGRLDYPTTAGIERLANRLGCGNVFVLLEEGMKPLVGNAWVVQIVQDAGGAWRQALLRELRDASFARSRSGAGRQRRDFARDRIEALSAAALGPLSLREMMNIAHYEQISTMYANILRPLLKAGYLETTCPPRSPDQRYRCTPAGHAALSRATAGDQPLGPHQTRSTR